MRKSENLDEDLVLKYRETGDLEWLGELFDRYWGLIYGVCVKYLKNREDSKDAAMELFEKLKTALLDHEVSQFRGWLYATTKNHCLMRLRASKGKQFVELEDGVMEFAIPMHLPEENTLEDDMEKLENCISRLGDDQRTCIQMFYLHKKCYDEICQKTGLTFNAVKSHIQNGKRNLKICLQENG